MRTIKFRGKCVPDSRYAGQWVVGGYVHPDEECKNQNEAIIVSYYGGNSTFTCHVIPETVGQFIGLLDKNGKEIYEGDIVRFKYGGPHRLKEIEGVIRFNKCCFELVPNTRPISVLFLLSGYDDSDSHRFEVIGNIHEKSHIKGVK